MSLSRRVAIAGIAGAILVVGFFTTPLWARRAPVAAAPLATRTPPPAPPGDTVIVYGPHQFTTPTGAQTFGVETFTLTLQPQRRYLLKVSNGNPNGTSRATDFSVWLNSTAGVTTPNVTDEDLGSAHSMMRIVQPVVDDTLTVSLAGPAGAFVTVSVLEVSDPTAVVHGPTTVTAQQVYPVHPHTVPFTVSGSATGAPHYLYVRNGVNGKPGFRFVRIELNGQTVVPSEELRGAATVVKQVTLLPTDTLRFVSEPTPGFGDWVFECFLEFPTGFICAEMEVTVLGTDALAPTLTIATPAQNSFVTTATVAVTGTVTDANATTVTVNGVVAARNGDNYSATANLAEGPNNILVHAFDAAGNTRDSSRNVTRDSNAPVLSVSPADNFITNNPQLTVSGTVSDATNVTVNVNGVPFTVDGGGNYSGQITLTEGTNFVVVSATDQANNVTSISRQGTLDTAAPALDVTSPANGSTTAQPTVTVAGTVSDATAVTVTVNGNPVTVTSGAFSTSVSLNPGPNTIAVVAADAATNVTTVNRSVTRNVGSDPLLVETLPMDNTLGAPPPAAGVATNVSASTRFIYEGPNAVQTGVQPGAIQPLQVAVVRGRVTDASGAPLSGVTVKATGRPELGSTLTRANGLFDLAVNGFGPVGINYSKAGYLNVSRQLTVAPLDYTPAPEVVMTALDTIVTAINFTAPIEVARGSARTDADGARTQRLLFQQGTTVKMVMANGDSVPLTGPIHVRATEYTVGSNGQKAMPAPLPPTSGYTYAVELSVDEAMAAGATTVAFSDTVWAYNENFLSLGVGAGMPSAYYDAAKRVWVGQGNGRIIKILSVAGGVATVDVTGSGSASPQDTLTAMGFTMAELQQLAQLYPAGQELWRMPLMHFSPNDFNSPIPCFQGGGSCPTPKLKPRNANTNSDDPAAGPAKKTKFPSCVDGSVIKTQEQTLGEVIPINGTQYVLTYETSRQLGFRAAYILDIPITESTMPSLVDSVKLELSVAGRAFQRTFLPLPNQKYRFEWDGLDAYGRPVIGQQPVKIRVGYGYLQAFPYTAYDLRLNWFGQWVLWPTTRTARVHTYFWTDWTDVIGPWDPRGLGLGGWTLSENHVLEVTSKRVMKGDGSQVRGSETVGPIIRTVAGRAGISGFSGDGGPANQASIANGDDFAFGQDGALYLTGTFRIRRVGTDGIIRTIAGTGSTTSSGDNGHARLAGMNAVRVNFLPDGSLVFYDTQLGTIRRISSDSIVRRFAGGGTSTVEGATALETSLVGIGDLIATADGNLYFVFGNKIRQITPAGLVFTVAGTGTCNISAAAEGTARDLPICPATTGQANRVLSMGPDGSLYVLMTNSAVKRIWPDGRLTKVAFGGTGSGVNGQPAMDANVGTVRSIQVGPDNTLYWHDAQSSVRAVSPEGIMRQVAGTGVQTVLPMEGAAATTDYIASAGHDLEVGPDGALFVGDDVSRIRRIGPPYPGLSAGEIVVAAADAGEAYVFNGDGRHLRTIESTMGVATFSFTYDTTGRLKQVTDGYGNITTVEHDAQGKPTAIVAPFGQRTQLTVDADGMLATVKPPATQPYAMTYGTAGANGLKGIMTSFVDPATGLHTFAYDSLGKLLTDSDNNGTQTLARVDSIGRYRVTHQDAGFVSATYHVLSLPTGDVRQVTVNPGSKPDTSDFHPDGGADHFLANGTWLRDRRSQDPRFGATAAYASNVLISTPGLPQTLVTRSHNLTLGLSGDPLKPQRIVDTVNSGVGFNTNTSITTFDAPTRTVEYRSAEGRRDTTFLDSLGRLIKTKPAGLAALTFSYDALGRLQNVARANRTLTWKYNAAGLVDTVIDPMQRRTAYAYDLAGRPTLIRRTDGRIVAIAFDSAGRPISLTPAGRPAHTFAYTPTGLLAAYTPPAVAGVPNPATTYRYDAAKRIAATYRPDGDSVSYSYDAAGRASVTRFPYATLTHSYNATTGNLTSISSTSDGGQTASFAFAGTRITAFTQSGGGVGGSVILGYDVHHRVTSRATSVFTDELLNMAYDRDDRLTSATISGGGLVYTRSPQTGLITGTTFNGNTTTTITYDSLGNQMSDSAARAGQALLTYHVTRDALDRIVTKTETVLGVQTQWAFSYDSVGRLLSVDRDGTNAATYVYDDNGNRLSRTTPSGSETGVYDDQDRLVSYGGAAYRYTAAGELRYKIVGSDTTEYHSDALGALRWVELPDGTRIDYVIDALGRRIGRKVNGTFTHRFLYESGLRIAVEKNSVGQTTTIYVYGEQTNVPEFMIRGGQAYRFITDHLGSARLVIRNGDGVVVQRIDYDEYGRVTSNSAPGFQPFGYAGGLMDDLTGLVQFGERAYSPHEGVWITPDPLGLAGGATNLYEYAFADPINRIDPTGLQGAPPPPPEIPRLIPPPPPGRSGQPNRWIPNDASSTPERPTFQPRDPVPNQSQPRLRFDRVARPLPHWEINDGFGNKFHFDQEGKPIDHWGNPRPQQGPRLPPPTPKAPPPILPLIPRILERFLRMPIFIVKLCPDGSLEHPKKGCSCTA